MNATHKFAACSVFPKRQVSFPLCYGLTETQMKTLGLYISISRSEKETGHNFADPGLLVINEQGTRRYI